MRPYSRPRARSRGDRAFTLIEVLVASALLGMVGLAALSFLSAVASGAAARSRVSDPAIEATLAGRRLAALVPSMRAVLDAEGDAAAIWLSDSVPSRTVHLSELGCVRFDAKRGEIVLERIPESRFLADRGLETELAADDDFLATLANARAEGLLSSALLAEGVDRAEFTRDPQSGAVDLSFEVDRSNARLRLTRALDEEPRR
jgi:prepilin-type N-terminal cleavage/methylation domain-containing protein